MTSARHTGSGEFCSRDELSALGTRHWPGRNECSAALDFQIRDKAIAEILPS